MRSKWLALLLLPAVWVRAQEYKIAQPGYRFVFPQDYFNHEDYQTEWWYYTGNVKAADGHRFGFELTFFRQGVSRADSRDPWFVHDLWMAHMALSDVTGQRFYSEERLNRAGPGVAGVDAPLVWNGNWQAHLSEQGDELRGAAEKFALALTVKPVKPTGDSGSGRGQPESGGHRPCFALFLAHSSFDDRIHCTGWQKIPGGGNLLDGSRILYRGNGGE